jgi:F-type H+-transporting ATPase subunit a
MRLIKAIVLTVLIVGLPAMVLRAEPASTATGEGQAEASEAAKPAHEGPLVSPAASILKEIPIPGTNLKIPITNSMVYTWVIGAVIFLLVRIGTKNLKETPSGHQNVIEAAVEGLEEMTKGLLEPKVVAWCFPLVATFFIFIVMSNLMALLPGVGSLGWGVRNEQSSLPFALEHTSAPLFRPPTADANTTVAMAGIFFIMSMWWALKYNGPFGLIKHIFGVKGGMKGLIVIPLAFIFIFIGLIEVVSILIRPVALAMRLYGNIYGGESVLAIMLGKFWGLPAIPFYFLELMVAVVQALVFTILCIAFIGTLCSHTEEEGGGHGDKAHAH